MTFSKNDQSLILNGPSKEAIKTALFAPKLGSKEVRAERIKFTTDDDQTHEVVLQEVRILSGQGIIFYLKGYAYTFVKELRGVPSVPRDVYILYRTDTRKGGLSFDGNEPPEFCLKSGSPHNEGRWHVCRPDVEAALRAMPQWDNNKK